MESLQDGSMRSHLGQDQHRSCHDAAVRPPPDPPVRQVLQALDRQQLEHRAQQLIVLEEQRLAHRSALPRQGHELKDSSLCPPHACDDIKCHRHATWLVAVPAQRGSGLLVARTNRSTVEVVRLIMRSWSEASCRARCRCSAAETMDPTAACTRCGT